MSYSPSDIYQALINAGIPSSDAGTLTQISGAESGYGASQIGAANRNGTTDYGLFQVNSGAWPQLNPSSLVDAPLATQASAAATVYKQQGLGAWSTYNSGAYQNFSTGQSSAGMSGAPSGAATGTSPTYGFDPSTGTYSIPMDPGGGNEGSTTPGATTANVAGTGGLFQQFTAWFAAGASRAGLFVLAVLFIIGALVLFGIKSGIEIESSPS